MKALLRFLLAIFVAIVIVATVTHLSKDGPPPKYHHWKHGTPIGFSLSDFQRLYLTEGSVRGIDAKLYASKVYFHANTDRLQIMQDRIGEHYDPAYFDYVCQTIDYGTSIGLNMVINAQTEWSKGFHQQEPMPTQATHVFWQHFLAKYKNNPHVIFDLFNEPRGKGGWTEWQNDFQPLVDEIRNSGAHNQIWVNGLQWGSTLEGVPMLHGGNIVYTYHHPAAPWEGPNDEQVNAGNWDKAFGYLADKKVPVVDAEFPNYGTKPNYYVWDHMGTTVPAYLHYLKVHHIGLMAWALQPGSINETSNLSSVTHAPHGDGAIIKRWFRQIWYANERQSH